MDDTNSSHQPSSRRARTIGFAVLAAVVTASAIALYRDRHTFADTLQRIGAASTAASFAAGLVGIGATFPAWHNVLRGLGVDLPRASAGRVFFVSQLGKYVPGALWPILLQVEAGRRYGAGRRTMLTAGAVTLVIGCTTGLLVGCALLPLSDTETLRRYWWAFFAIPGLLALLHPRALPMLVDRAGRLLGRPPSGERLQHGAELRACGWSLLSWVGLGTHLAILCAAVGYSLWSALALSIGAMGFAVALGVLFVPAPAGVGVREVVLTLALSSRIHGGTALAVVVASRALLICCDIALAGAATVIARRVPDQRLRPQLPRD